MTDTHKYHFDVKMTCGACSRAIERVLGKLEGVTSYTVNLEQQSVDVEASVPFETVLEKIKNTGKEVLDAKVIA
ncbi:Cytosolic copper metallochaperone [Malassezia arunalokei]|uniref:Cytosolic copper metallochaperone n=1 Tax=Malassezia arunalokei TaxID=1514897 RepID=A0AAJ5Z091_9BASI|nr:Cytosolic copper metallochaperone [Malassezia arunalokei]